MAERDGLVDALAIERQRHGLAHPRVVPGRFRIPLIGEIDPERRVDHHRLQREPRRALQLLGQLAADRVGEIDLAALQRREPRGLVGNHLPDQLLHGGRLAPVAVERLHHQFDARGEGGELVRSRADGLLLEAVLAHALDVFFRHDPARAGDARIVEEEIGPRLVQAEDHAPRIGCFHRRHLLLDEARGVAAIALEGELHVLRRHRRAIVEGDAGAQHEAVAQPVGGGGIGLRQARLGRIARHRLHQPVMQGVEQHEGRDDARRFRRIEPGRRQRDVRGIDELAVRRLGRFRAGRQDTERSEAQQLATRRARIGNSMVTSGRTHGSLPVTSCQTCLMVTSSYGAE